MPLNLTKYSLPYLAPILSNRSLRKVVRTKNLAQLGDLITNFIYSAVRIGTKGANGAVHVWDISLGDAIREAELRQYFPNRVKRDEMADGAEAIIGYAYFTELMTLDEMIAVLDIWVQKEDLQFHLREKKGATAAFVVLLKEIITRCREAERFEDLN